MAELVTELILWFLDESSMSYGCAKLGKSFCLKWELWLWNWNFVVILPRNDQDFEWAQEDAIYMDMYLEGFTSLVWICMQIVHVKWWLK